MIQPRHILILLGGLIVGHAIGKLIIFFLL